MYLAVSGSGDVYFSTVTLSGFVASAPKPCYGGFSYVVLLHLNAQGAWRIPLIWAPSNRSPLAWNCPAITAFSGNLNYVPVLARITFGQTG